MVLCGLNSTYWFNLTDLLWSIKIRNDEVLQLMKTDRKLLIWYNQKAQSTLFRAFYERNKTPPSTNNNDMSSRREEKTDKKVVILARQ